jgi:hypothetical protein
VTKPVFSEEDLAARAERLQPLIAFELEQNKPMLKDGHELDCRLLDGMVAKGTISAVETNALLLRKSTGTEQKLPFALLDPATRVSVDEQYRDDWSWSLATVEARNEIAGEGIEIPVFRCGNSEEFGRALNCGDPEAHCIAGIQCLSGTKRQKDPAYAYLHLRISAMQNNAKSQYHLGAMIYNGHGMAPNIPQGLSWISLSASQGYAPAARFLTQHKINQQATAEAVRKAEKEKLEYAARLEEARVNPKYQTISASTGFKTIRREKPWWDRDVHVYYGTPYRVVY